MEIKKINLSTQEFKNTSLLQHTDNEIIISEYNEKQKILHQFIITLESKDILDLMKWQIGQWEYQNNQRKHVTNIEQNIQEIITSYDKKIVEVQAEFGHNSFNELILKTQQDVYKHILHGKSTGLSWNGYEDFNKKEEPHCKHTSDVVANHEIVEEITHYIKHGLKSDANAQDREEWRIICSKIEPIIKKATSNK